MRWQEAPHVDFDSQAEYRWNFDNVGLQEADLFESLHSKFNEHVPLLDPDTFHHLVDDLATNTSTKAEFFDKLEERRLEQLSVLSKMRNRVYARVLQGHSKFNDDQFHWFMHLHRYGGVNSLVFFLGSLVGLSPVNTPPYLGMLHLMAPLIRA